MPPKKQMSIDAVVSSGLALGMQVDKATVAFTLGLIASRNIPSGWVAVPRVAWPSVAPLLALPLTNLVPRPSLGKWFCARWEAGNDCEVLVGVGVAVVMGGMAVGVGASMGVDGGECVCVHVC